MRVNAKIVIEVFQVERRVRHSSWGALGTVKWTFPDGRGPGSGEVISQGRTRASALRNVTEAVALYLEDVP